MACHRTDKTIPGTNSNCWLNPWEHTPVKYEWKFAHFLSKKIRSKHCLQYGRQFVPTSVCYLDYPMIKLYIYIKNIMIFIEQNAFQSVICKMSPFLFRPQCVNFPFPIFPRISSSSSSSSSLQLSLFTSPCPLCPLLSCSDPPRQGQLWCMVHTSPRCKWRPIGTHYYYCPVSFHKVLLPVTQMPRPLVQHHACSGLTFYGLI